MIATIDCHNTQTSIHRDCGIEAYSKVETLFLWYNRNREETTESLCNRQSEPSFLKQTKAIRLFPTPYIMDTTQTQIKKKQINTLSTVELLGN